MASFSNIVSLSVADSLMYFLRCDDGKSFVEGTVRKVFGEKRASALVQTRLAPRLQRSLKANLAS